MRTRSSQVADLLDHVIYEQVLACVVLDALHDLEQALTVLAGGVDAVSPDHAADLAKACSTVPCSVSPTPCAATCELPVGRSKAAEPCGEEARLAGRSHP